MGAALGSSSIGFANPGLVWDLRLPRVILAFLTGASLAVSGAVFQSILKNQLASPYLLGVSSGASLGAALVMMGGIAAVAGAFTLPLGGFVFGLGTVFLVIALASALDRSLSNNTIILFGMICSLFVNAILTVLSSLFRRELRDLIIWQMGSFALRGWGYVRLMVPFFIAGILGILRYVRELDLLSFGEEEALSMGVNARRVRKGLFFFAALLTGASVALCGVIGFVDLIAPHAARRIAGSAHRWVIFLSFCIGGILLVTADLIARLVISPSELPVGAVTALIGAPFFAWVYFRKR